MDWVKLFTDLPDHDKLIAAGGDDGWHEHGWLYTCGLCYAGKHETDGLIPKPLAAVLAPTIPDARKVIADLVRVGLWHEEGAHYRINHYGDRQQTKEQLEETRQKRSEAGKKAARARWGDADGMPNASESHTESDNTTDAHVDASSNSHSSSTSLSGFKAVVASVRDALLRCPHWRLDDVSDPMRLLSAIEAHPAVDPVQAAHSAVARGKVGLDPVDALLRELRALETRQQRTTERQGETRVHPAAARERELAEMQARLEAEERAA